MILFFIFNGDRFLIWTIIIVPLYSIIFVKDVNGKIAVRYRCINIFTWIHVRFIRVLLHRHIRGEIFHFPTSLVQHFLQHNFMSLTLSQFHRSLHQRLPIFHPLFILPFFYIQSAKFDYLVLPPTNHLCSKENMSSLKPSICKIKLSA